MQASRYRLLHVLRQSLSRIGYLDCFSGASGDMLLGALLHAGLDEHLLRQEICKLHIPGLQLDINKISLQGIGACRIAVHVAQPQQLRTLPTIFAMLDQAALATTVCKQAKAIFTRLAEAEAKVHNVDIEKVHFHEVGAVDTLVDIVGVIFGLQQLQIDHLYCSPLPMGHGFVDCAHGRLPLPAPAVCELLRDVPVYGTECDQELVTPTGGAIIATLAEAFGPLPPMSIDTTGYGAGSRESSNGQPNLLRLFVGRSRAASEEQLIEIIETNLDDWSPETFPHLCAKLFNQGALDVTLTPTQMKKGRPGFILQVICSPAVAHQLKECILSETTAIGLRFYRASRLTLSREIITVTTPWGKLRAKKVATPAGTVIYPEYEECCRLAASSQVPLLTIYNAVRNTNT
jgi:uncharacterized protein (TIGR00299 family) protein